jgi:hypothetical protein
MILDPNDPNYQQQLAQAQNVAPSAGFIGETPRQMGTDTIQGTGGTRSFAGFGDDLGMLGLLDDQERMIRGANGNGTPQPIGTFNTQMGSPKDDPLFNLRQYNAQNNPSNQSQGFGGLQGSASPSQSFGQGANGYSGAGSPSSSGGGGGSGVFPLQGNYGIVKMQAGGQAGGLSQKPDSLDFMSNNMYPGSQQDMTEYAAPAQLPAGAQATAMRAAYEAKINPITGELMDHYKKGGLTEAAKYVQARGRGNDTQLMHVTPGELRGLQSLAMAHGGSLSINPHTGLPEAGFLEDILPVAAAGAMMYFAPGVGPAIGAGLGLGEGALATGVGMGLLSGGISAAGQLLSTGKIDLGSALRTGAISGLTAGAISGFSGAPTSNVKTDVPAVELAKQTASNTPIVQGNFTAPTLNNNSFAYNAQGEMVPSNYPASVTGSTNSLSGPTPPPGTDKSWWKSLTPGQQLATGLGGVAGLSLLAGANQPKIQTPPSTSYIRPYTYAQTRNPNYGQPGQNYYTQGYTAQPIFKAAQGGLMAAGGPADSGYIPTSQAVKDYSKMLSDRAVQEYVNSPPPSALLPVSQQPIAAPVTPQAPAISQDINGLYQYYLGRQPGKDEVGQWANQISGPVTADMANYFQQHTGGELAKTGYKPQGPNPFLGEAANPVSGSTGSLAAQAGLPQFTYNAATKSYMPVAQQAAPFVQPAATTPILDSSSGGGKAGGMMPNALRYDRGGKAEGENMFEGLSEKEKRSMLMDMISAKLESPQAQYVEGLGFMTPPPSVGGRLGANMDALGGNLRAGVSGNVMQTPDKKILANPGMMDIGYASKKESAYDPFYDVSLQRAIKSAPGRSKDYAVTANYTMPFVAGGQTGYNLGGYSDGGRLLKGPGDGMSDNIPASIGHKQPARLADGEFVVPADVVSHLGNGSTDAGAKKLYAMMDKVRTARVGTKKQGKEIKAEKYLPT